SVSAPVPSVGSMICTEGSVDAHPTEASVSTVRLPASSRNVTFKSKGAPPGQVISTQAPSSPATPPAVLGAHTGVAPPMATQKLLCAEPNDSGRLRASAEFVVPQTSI